MRIHCIRHGETEDNALDIKGRPEARLSARGKEQARKLARRFEGDDVVFDRIFSSPLIRAVQTADAIAGSMGVEVEVRQGLAARKLGVLTGCSGDVFREWMERESWDSRPEGGESLLDLEARVVGELNRIKERHEGERVLVVVHQGVLRVLDHAFAGIAEDDTMARKGYASCTLYDYEI